MKMKKNRKNDFVRVKSARRFTEFRLSDRLHVIIRSIADWSHVSQFQQTNQTRSHLEQCNLIRSHFNSNETQRKRGRSRDRGSVRNTEVAWNCCSHFCLITFSQSWLHSHAHAILKKRNRKLHICAFNRLDVCVDRFAKAKNDEIFLFTENSLKVSKSSRFNRMSFDDAFECTTQGIQAKKKSRRDRVTF